MFQAINVTGDEQRARFCQIPGFIIDPGVLARQRPDALWLLQHEQSVARCGLWWQQTPAFEGHRLGLIGHYFAHDFDAGAALLRVACRELAAQGCTLAVGPMDGNTWQRYRLLSERGAEPLFFLEPDNPDDWPGHFTASGFTPLSQYYSAVTDDLATEEPRLPAIAANLESLGVQVRNLRPDGFEAELRAIYTLSRESFAANFLYTPISEQDFLEQYRGIQPCVRPELVFLAERAGELVGFLFCFPDRRQLEYAPRINTVIVKTMATQPKLQGSGLGSLLMARCHVAAHRLGYRRAIHALMHEGNHSRKISGHTARVFRRYTLYARPLDQRP